MPHATVEIRLLSARVLFDASDDFQRPALFIKFEALMKPNIRRIFSTVKIG